VRSAPFEQFVAERFPEGVQGGSVPETTVREGMDMDSLAAGLAIAAPQPPKRIENSGAEIASLLLNNNSTANTERQSTDSKRAQATPSQSCSRGSLAARDRHDSL